MTAVSGLGEEGQASSLTKLEEPAWRSYSRRDSKTTGYLTSQDAGATTKREPFIASPSAYKNVGEQFSTQAKRVSWEYDIGLGGEGGEIRMVSGRV